MPSFIVIYINSSLCMEYGLFQCLNFVADIEGTNLSRVGHMLWSEEEYVRFSNV